MQHAWKFSAEQFSADQFSVHQFVVRNALSQKHLRRIGSNWRGPAVADVQVDDVRNFLMGRNFERVAA